MLAKLWDWDRGFSCAQVRPEFLSFFLSLSSRRTFFFGFSGFSFCLAASSALARLRTAKARARLNGPTRSGGSESVPVALRIRHKKKHDANADAGNTQKKQN